VILGLSPSCQIGGQAIGTGTVDVNLLGAAFIMDSTNILAPGNPLNLFAFLPTTGNFNLSVTASFPAGALGTVQAALINPAYPGGAEMTQAHSITVIQSSCSGQTTPYAAPLDDGFLQVNLTVVPNVAFYGVTYTSIFIGTNGFLSFGTGSTDFSATEAEWLSMQPRIAPNWGDFSPNVAGTISYTESALTGIFTCTWLDVPVYLATAGDMNSFCASVDLLTGQVGLAWDRMNRNGGVYNAIITGITPGNNVSLANNIDFSAYSSGTPYTAPNATAAVYENFIAGTFGPFDLAFSSKTLFPNGGIGTGPYILQ
jgi:hypothetical protein